jgi:hypothetical protein
MTVNIDDLSARLNDDDKVLFDFSDEEIFVLTRALAILKSAMYERVPGPFIAGVAGKADEMGLPELLHVCPSYGLEGTATYEKVRDYEAPGW